MNSHSHFLTATVQGSLYGTAKRYNIPSKIDSADDRNFYVEY